MKFSVLLLGKKDDPYFTKAHQECKKLFVDVQCFVGDWNDPLPKECRNWNGDLIISYLSRWVVPDKLLKSAKFAAINFHPGPPEFPGIGCINFALYQNSKQYGVTSHHMAPVVDTGKIIDVRRFPIEKNDNVETLLTKTYETLFDLFLDVVRGIAEQGTLPVSNEQWTRKAYTRAEFNDLFVITKDMNEEEVRKRTRAVTYKQWKPIYKNE